jgi:hypothetical protein
LHCNQKRQMKKSDDTLLQHYQMYRILFQKSRFKSHWNYDKWNTICIKWALKIWSFDIIKYHNDCKLKCVTIINSLIEIFLRLIHLDQNRMLTHFVLVIISFISNHIVIMIPNKSTFLCFFYFHQYILTMKIISLWIKGFYSNINTPARNNISL